MEGKEKPKKRSKSSWLSETVFIFLIPLLGYIIAFISEYAYFRGFRIPVELIQITYSNLFNSIIFSIIFISCSNLIFCLALVLFKATKLKKYLSMLILIITSIIFLIFVALLSFKLPIDSRNIFSMAIFLMLFLIVGNLVMYANFEEKIVDFGKFVLMFVILSSIFLLPFLYDNQDSFKKLNSKYFVLDGSPEMIVLRTYDDISICVPFDRKTHTIYPHFSIKKTSEINMPLKYEKLGIIFFEDEIINMIKNEKKSKKN